MRVRSGASEWKRFIHQKIEFTFMASSTVSDVKENRNRENFQGGERLNVKLFTVSLFRDRF